MEKEHPIESLMVTAMTSLESMVDVNTIVGDIVTTSDGTVIIPVSKVSFGFAAGGSEFNTNKLNKYSESVKLPFGGGSGAGVNIAPMAFLVVKDGSTNLLTLNNTTPIDKLVELIPDLVDKVNSFINKSFDKNQNDNYNDIDKASEE
ncbi:MAG: GerW family sporulation protein [Clostridia bacterium]|nr:GerW family sporulation protein [Clostridia bacterium]MDD4387557.1 GerW family sporulation protein [Clostridia bacterium]